MKYSNFSVLKLKELKEKEEKKLMQMMLNEDIQEIYNRLDELNKEIEKREKNGEIE